MNEKKPFPETLDEVWSECIRMHEDLSKPKNGQSKYIWLQDNGYEPWTIFAECFFCQYANAASPANRTCQNCPAVLVDPEFSCTDIKYTYDTYDGKFATKLKELNKIRKELRT